MASRVYKLISTATASASAVATLTLIRGGKITAVDWTAAGTGGAGVSLFGEAELAVNAGTAQLLTNDTPGTSISMCAFQCNVASSGFAGGKGMAGMSVPVQSGDKLYMHLTVSGTTPSACHVTAHVVVSD